MVWFFKEFCNKDDRKAELLNMKAQFIIDEKTQDYAVLYNDCIVIWDKITGINNEKAQMNNGILSIRGKQVLKDICYVIPVFNQYIDTEDNKHNIEGFALVTSEQYGEWLSGKFTKAKPKATSLLSLVEDSKENKESTNNCTVKILKPDRELHEATLENIQLIKHKKFWLTRLNWSSALLNFQGNKYYTILSNETSEVNGFVVAKIGEKYEA